MECMRSVKYTPSTPMQSATRYVANQITLTADFLSAVLKSPNISDEYLLTVEAMIWLSRQSEPHVGQISPSPIDFAPKYAWSTPEPQRVHRTHILCMLLLQHRDSLE